MNRQLDLLIIAPSARKLYQQLANERDEVKIIDASQPIEAVSEQTKHLVGCLL